MRAAVRPLLLFVLLFGFTSATRTDAQTDPVTPIADPLNYLGWAKGSPAPVMGGVDVTVTQQADPAFTCTQVVIRVIDGKTGATLDTLTVNNPGMTVTTTFTNLGQNRAVLVTAEATFESAGAIDTKLIKADVIIP